MHGMFEVHSIQHVAAGVHTYLVRDIEFLLNQQGGHQYVQGGRGEADQTVRGRHEEGLVGTAGDIVEQLGNRDGLQNLTCVDHVDREGGLVEAVEVARVHKGHLHRGGLVFERGISGIGLHFVVEEGGGVVDCYTNKRVLVDVEYVWGWGLDVEDPFESRSFQFEDRALALVEGQEVQGVSGLQEHASTGDENDLPAVYLDVVFGDDTHVAQGEDHDAVSEQHGGVLFVDAEVLRRVTRGVPG